MAYDGPSEEEVCAFLEIVESRIYAPSSFMSSREILPQPLNQITLIKSGCFLQYLDNIDCW